MKLRLKNRCKRCGAFLSVEEPKARVEHSDFWPFMFHLVCMTVGVALGRYFP